MSASWVNSRWQKRAERGGRRQRIKKEEARAKIAAMMSKPRSRAENENRTPRGGKDERNSTHRYVTLASIATN